MKVPQTVFAVALLALTATLTIPTSALAAASTVSIASPAGIYAPLDIALDGPGVIRINSASLNSTGAYVNDGPCVLDRAAGYNAAGPYIGATCTGAGSVHFTTTGTLTSTCPVDGGTLEGLHLTIKVDNAVVYDQQLWPNPITCWTTAPRQATTSWAAPVMRFDNSAQARPSAATIMRVADVNWNYSAHSFVVPAGITCSTNLVDIDPSRYIIRLAERGFACQGIVAASTVVVVSVT